SAYRHCRFVDLMDFLAYFASLGDSEDLTDNGMHLNGAGYRFTVPGLMLGLDVPFSTGPWSVSCSAQHAKSPTAVHTRIEAVDGGLVRFRLTDESLFWAMPGRTIRIADLAPGDYALAIDGQRVAQASAQIWARGVEVNRGPEFTHAEKLRETIVAKN